MMPNWLAFLFAIIAVLFMLFISISIAVKPTLIPIGIIGFIATIGYGFATKAKYRKKMLTQSHSDQSKA